MTTRMLIDATQEEEIRVAIVENNKLLEYDFEIASRKQLKGNIYLARVTRVEPSLQAAFVEYGGNRHGFLAFSEIHPDYYRIPVADREALLAAQAALAREAEEDDYDDDLAPVTTAAAIREGSDDLAEEAISEEVVIENSDNPVGDEEEIYPETAAPELSAPAERTNNDEEVVERKRRDSRDRSRSILRQYKIQEVTARRQIMLVQVTKEERGNKGAALTTYLSLAGRYCVLMPNSPRGGGVSRKITSHQDRRRMKELIQDLEVPPGMSVILRTAGVERTKAEIKRDLDYLLRQWDTIREMTLKSSAPALIYEEGNLIKRTIRDMYTAEIDEVQISGDAGYRAAKELMRMLMPSHAKKVQPYRDTDVPMFFRYQVESQIEAFHDPVVQLKSGGYIVINPTEALVSIDVNSGKSTRERHIEETALRTNLEAAQEIARQLRLRDLAGLVVIDFIDMEEPKNNAAVERKIKDALRLDRARIQVGRISSFGLLELSRQRLRPSLFETSFEPCVASRGTGYIRTVESSALQALRHIHEEALRRRSDEIHVLVETTTALYLLNHKRAQITELEQQYELRIIIDRDDTLIRPDLRIDRVIPKQARPALSPGNEDASRPLPVRHRPDEVIDEDDDLIDDADDNDTSADNGQNRDGARDGAHDGDRPDRGGERGDRNRNRSRNRNRRRRRGERPWSEDRPTAVTADTVIDDEGADNAEGADSGTESAHPRPDNRPEGDGDDRFRRRRGRRGGRYRRGRRDEGNRYDQDGRPYPRDAETPRHDADHGAANDVGSADYAPVEVTEPVTPAAAPEAVTESAPAETTSGRAPRARTPRSRAAKAAPEVATETGDNIVETDGAVVEKTAKPRRRTTSKTSTVAAVTESAPVVQEPVSVAPVRQEEPARDERAAARAAETVVLVDDLPENKPRKGGWWQKIIG